MAHYVNPLHPPIPPSTHTPFSSISSAVAGGPAPPAFLSPTRRRVPQPPYVPASKWKASVGRRHAPEPPVFFDTCGYPGQGVPMRELSSRGASALGAVLRGANDAVLLGAGHKTITFRILWPGYDHVEWARPIEVCSPHGPVTRAQIGVAIAKNYGRYIEKTQYEATRSSEWRLGPGGVGFEHLILLSLWNVFDDAWQADVAVDVRY